VLLCRAKFVATEITEKVALPAGRSQGCAGDGYRDLAHQRRWATVPRLVRPERHRAGSLPIVRPRPGAGRAQSREDGRSARTTVIGDVASAAGEGRPAAHQW